MEWITKSPFRWPTFFRLTFLFALPISVPLWIACWMFYGSLYAAFVIIFLGGCGSWGCIVWLWTGQKPEWM